MNTDVFNNEDLIMCGNAKDTGGDKSAVDMALKQEEEAEPKVNVDISYFKY